MLNLKIIARADGTAYFVRAASYECNMFIKSSTDTFYDIGLWFEVETEKNRKTFFYFRPKK